MPTYETFLDQVEANSLESDFKTKRGVTLPSGGTADLAASRTKFFWPAVMFFSQHLLVRYLPNATVQDFQRLFDAGFRYGKSVNRVPLFRGLQFGYFILPVIAVDRATQELKDFASAAPKKHWALFEFPVLHELATGRTYFHRSTPLWGALINHEVRKLAEEIVEGS